MEKIQWLTRGFKCHNRLWFVLTSFFLIFTVLICTDYSSLKSGRTFNRVAYCITNFANVIVTQNQDHQHGPNSPPTLVDIDSQISNETKLISYGNTSSDSSTNSTASYSFGIGNEPRNIISSNESQAATVTYVPPPQKMVDTIVQIDKCAGRYIYMYDLPKRFNQDLLKNCHSLQKWTDMCPFISNMGFGLKLIDKSSRRGDRLFASGKGWYATNQFTLEVTFHNRMKKYKCLTNDSSLASAIYVPFYAGLDVGQYLWGSNTSIRDASPMALANWLAGRPEWKTMWGKDHFLIGGRIAWDFRRETDSDSGWGSKLMLLPQAKNMTLLAIESSSWRNEQAIPYPTYFHPSKKSQLLRWQARMRRLKRPTLFTFAGAPRTENKDNIRNMVISQCQSSKHCKLVGCYHGSTKCDDPLNVIKAFQSSVFCLQPSGDSYTRRSIFDAILAGCIPVFFHPGSAYMQYTWHFPSNASAYSVFISETDIKKKNVMIEEALLRIPNDEVAAMREQVIRIIPRIVYADPRETGMETLEDAFDIAVNGILEKVERTRREMQEGRDEGEAFSQLEGHKFDMPK